MINRKRKYRFALLSLLFVFSGVVIADENSTSAENETKTESSKSNPIFAAFQSDMGLDSSRRFGVETNFFRILSWNGREKTFSGTVSVFNHEHNFEFAFPVLVGDGITTNGIPYREAFLDVSFRKFIASPMAGVYVAVFMRSAFYKGRVKRSPYDSLSSSDKIEQGLRGGFGLSIGYRAFSRSGIYWGFGINGGQYFSGDLREYWRDGVWSEHFGSDEQIIKEVEFLKFGYAFR